MAIEAPVLAARISRETGLPFSGKKISRAGNVNTYVLSPQGHPESQTFQLVAHLGWRSVEVVFEQGAFSADLIGAMGRADDSGQQVFRAVIEAVIADGATVIIKVNDVRHEIIDAPIWEHPWRTFFFSFRKGQIAFGEKLAPLEDDVLLQWASRAAAAVVALLPLEPSVAGESADDPALPEGALQRVEVNRYERDRRNRAAALAIHGFACKACGHFLSDIYGEPGVDFIEVHHVTPVSEMGAGYLVNPRNDLIPLCPNCHGITHRRSPPYSVAEIQKMIRPKIN